MIALIGCLGHIMARVCYGLADTTFTFFLGGIFYAFGPIVLPVLKSMVSKMVAPSERGKAFVIFTMFNNIGSFIGGVLFAKVELLHFYKFFYFIPIAFYRFTKQQLDRRGSTC